MSYRTLGNYRQVINIKNIDTCEVFGQDFDKRETAYQCIVNDVNNIAGKVFHKCPYNGPFKLQNYSVPFNEYPTYPKGDYIITLRFYDRVDVEGIEFKVFFTVISLNGTIW